MPPPATRARLCTRRSAYLLRWSAPRRRPNRRSASAGGRFSGGRSPVHSTQRVAMVSARARPPGACRTLLRRLPPRERERFAEQFFVNGLEPHGGTSLPSPRAVLGCERRPVALDELRLLIRRQLDHSPRVIMMQRGEDAPFDAKIRMAHVRALDGALHPECDAAEVICVHVHLLVIGGLKSRRSALSAAGW